jgi:hypothetical protein
VTLRQNPRQSRGLPSDLDVIFIAALASSHDNEYMQLRQKLRIAVACFLLLAPATVRAADVLQEIPNDALGFVVVHKLGTVDAKIKTLSSDLRNNAFSPLEFLKSAAGVQEGLDPNGDFLLAVYKDGNADTSELQFGVWLPVTDYAAFAKSIGATSTGGVAAATVAGQDLLIAHRGDWAIVMDPDQKQRMAQLVATRPSPPPEIAAWKTWIASNDVTVVTFAPGVHELWSWLEERFENKSGNENSDDLFGARDTGAPRDRLMTNANHPSPKGLAGILNEIHKWASASPGVEQAIQQASMAGCGFRLNVDGSQHGNVQAKLRVAFDAAMAHESSGDAELPFSMLEGDHFVIHGAGRLPKPMLTGLATTCVQRMADDLKAEEHTQLDEESLKQLGEAVAQAAGDVSSFALLTRPGDKPQPIYSNQFIAVRVASANKFLSQAAEVMRLWNKANREAQGETRLIFEAEETKLGNRSATQYSLDMVALAGEPILPETRQMMEKLFGPGGKQRVWLVRADEQTVLVACGTQDQVAAALKNFDRKQPVDFNKSQLQEENRLLSPESTWRVFFDPHRYNIWQRDESAAMTGVPVIGGPLVKPLRECPPIAVGGSVQEKELTVEIAAKQATVKSVYDYYSPTRTRREVQRPLQPAPR